MPIIGGGDASLAPAPAGGDEGDAGESQGDGEPTPVEGLYDLDSAPEEYRPYLSAELKKIEGNVTRKLQEAADHRSRWEPFEQLGIGDVPPEELGELLELRQIASDPESFRQWWQAIGEQYGFNGDGQPAADGEPDGEGDGEAANLEDMVRNVVSGLLEERLGPIESQFAEQQGEAAVQQELESITSELDALKEEHGEFDRDAVCQLALAYADDPDAIAKGFADYQRITGSAERGLLESKEDGPAGALEGGRAATAPDPIKTFSAASVAARERFRAG